LISSENRLTRLEREESHKPASEQKESLGPDPQLSFHPVADLLGELKFTVTQ
jgi:hypothetical protein